MCKKKVLVTGTNGYISNIFYNKNKDIFEIDLISVRSKQWKEMDFSLYDSLIHLSAIVHRSKGISKEEYEKTNVSLTRDLALKAKDSGVKQFIFMSTMAVYGEEGKLDQDVVIDHTTLPVPKTDYGISKLKAENLLRSISEDCFKVAIVRPPMIYGKACPGNYKALKELVMKTPVFPKMNDNKRSMLHVVNLCEFLKLLVLSGESGLYLPQDEQLMSTTNLVKQIAGTLPKQIYFSRTLAFPLKVLSHLNIPQINKVFGNLYYKPYESNYFGGKYRVLKYPQNISESIN